MRFIVGLTGGIGSGKTAVSDYFSELGIDVVDADVCAHQITQIGSPILQALKAQFGDWVLNADGSYNRQAMRQYVFGNAQALAELNRLMHPAIRHLIVENLNNATSAYVILSVPLLFEMRQQSPSLLDLCDAVLVVDVPTHIQKMRASERDANSQAQIQAIMNKQISRDQRLSVARAVGADIVDNSTTRAHLYEQLAPLHQKYLQAAANSQ